LHEEILVTDAVVSSDSLSDADRQGLNDRPPEQQQTTELDVDDLFLMPLVSKRSSRQLRRTSLQLYRKSREKHLASEPFSEGKWSGVNEQDKDMRNNENCTEDISSKPDIPPKSVQSSEQQDALSPRKNTSYQTHKVAKQRKRKNLHSLPHEDKSDDVEIENVIASLAACSSGAESVVNASDLLPDMTVRLQSIEEYKEDPSTIAEKQDVCPAATYPLALSKFCEHTSVDSAGNC
jgi:hypothetical protein